MRAGSWLIDIHKGHIKLSEQLHLDIFKVEDSIEWLARDFKEEETDKVLEKKSHCPTSPLPSLINHAGQFQAGIKYYP
jgi:hypothetical protein